MEKKNKITDEEAQGHEEQAVVPLPLHAWMNSVRGSEIAASASGFTAADLKLLCVGLQALVFKSADMFQDQGSDLDKIVTSIPQGNENGKNLKFELKQESLGEPTFRLWGRVVDEQCARSANRLYLLPIATVQGTTFYIDGSRYTNPHRSDCCYGWLVNQVPAPLPVEENSSDAPEAKRARKGKKEVKKSKPQEPKDKVVIFTHVLKFDDEEATIKLHLRKPVVVKVRLPYLAPNNEVAMEARVGTVLKRLPYDWDASSLKRLERPKVTLKGKPAFGMK